MDQVSVLKQQLRPHIHWHGARLHFLCLFLLALLKVRTVNLPELSLAFGERLKLHPAINVCNASFDSLNGMNRV